MTDKLRKARDNLFLDPLEYMRVAGDDWEARRALREAPWYRRLWHWFTAE